MLGEIQISGATELPEGFFEALGRWRVEAEEILVSGRVQWFARLASTTFVYREKRYRVSPSDVFSKETVATEQENFLDAAFELLQKSITRDLEALGAENVRNWGFLD